ncbi:hypothetical protein FZC79_14450 [Rossellomorea vietnamensis]|uniref:Uncharacterized protein n=1 Tax=Rossellomorea vietnamensis TaxID=218284 RepID=A0A5D4KBB3_9BACI|nr:CBO0543 family protein [Rossellomorea vietnamensis]TYR74667.1 hypothetical protein FZC79_14450 [Rossellomorea vietnamensis]
MVVLISIAVTLLLIYFIMPQKLKRIEIYSVFFSSLYSALAFDALFKGRFNLYYYGSDAEVHYIDFMFRLCLYPLTCLILLNLFPQKLKLIWRILYLIGWALLLTLIEWGMLQLSVIKYDGWKLSYSPLKYGLIFCLVLLNWVVTKKLAMQSPA